jgi:hypothetical protein
VNPRHIYGEDVETPRPVNKKENAPSNAKLLNHRRIKALTTVLLKTYETAVNDGVTRATRISTYNQIDSTFNRVPVVVIEQAAQDFSQLPTVAKPR